MGGGGVDSRTSYAPPPRDDTPLQDGTPLSSVSAVSMMMVICGAVVLMSTVFLLGKGSFLAFCLDGRGLGRFVCS